MALLKKIDTATFTGVTMGTVVSATVDYRGIFVSTYGGGSYTPAQDIRGVSGTANVVYQTPDEPAALDLAANDLVLTCTDDAAGTVTVTCPGFKPAGNRIVFGASDYTNFEQDFTLAPGVGSSLADVAPTVG